MGEEKPKHTSSFIVRSFIQIYGYDSMRYIGSFSIDFFFAFRLRLLSERIEFWTIDHSKNFIEYLLVFPLNSDFRTKQVMIIIRKKEE